MALPVPLILSVAFLLIALARFAVAIGDDRFLASTRQASKAAYGFAMATTLFALPLIDLASTTAHLVPLGVFGLSGLFLAPPTRRYTFILTAAGFLAALIAAGAYIFAGPPFGLLMALPVALLFGHTPIPGRPSTRFLVGLPVGALLAWTLPSPLFLAPVPLLMMGLPHGAPYPVIGEEAQWDHKMMYYLGLLGTGIATMLALWAGAGGPLQDPSLDTAQVAVGLLGASILLVIVIKVIWGALDRFRSEPDELG